MKTIPEKGERTLQRSRHIVWWHQMNICSVLHIHSKRIAEVTAVAVGRHERQICPRYFTVVDKPSLWVCLKLLLFHALLEFVHFEVLLDFVNSIGKQAVIFILQRCKMNFM